MQFRTVHCSLLLILLAFLIVPSKMFSQTSTNGTENSPVEIQNEPRHYLKFENQFVRVWDALIPAGSATLWHIHSHDNVVVTLSDAHVRIETVGAAPVETNAKTGDVAFRNAPYVHRTMSIGATAFHNIAIEILTSPGKTATPTETNENAQTPAIDNEHVRVYKITLGPGESTGQQIVNGSSLEVALTPGKVETVRNGESTTRALTAGDLSWREKASTRSLKNIGTRRFEAAVIELK